MTTKLKQLTLVSMASQYRVMIHIVSLMCVMLSPIPQTLSYNMLLQLLSLENVRQLEDLIIDAIYCGIIEGRLDQENKVVCVNKNHCWGVSYMIISNALTISNINRLVWGRS